MSIDELDVETPKDDRGRSEIIQPKLGPIGWARWIWRQLTSMRTALLLLLLLAVAAIPGSIFPQTRIDATRVQTYLADHKTLGPWVTRLNGFSVYSSPWFSAVYLLLFISLVGCVVPRARLHAKAIGAIPPRAPRRLERMPAYATSETALAPELVLEQARKVLRRKRYRVAVHDDASVSAERGYLSETGNLVFHLSLLALLAAVGAGTFVGYNGQTVVVVGKDFANTISQYDTFTSGRSVSSNDLPPFSLTLNSLDVKFDHTSAGNQFGAARDFTAEVSYRKKPGAPVEQRTMKVNRPLQVDGARVFLVGNGYAPMVTVRDAQGNIAAKGPVPFTATDSKYTSNGVIKGPDAFPQPIGLIAFLLPTESTLPSGQPVSVFPDWDNPRLVFTAYTGDMGMDDDVARSVYVLDVSKMTQVTQNGRPYSAMLAPGQSVKLPNGAGSVTFDGVERFAALNVRSDPTKGWVLGSSILALVGLTLSLFVRRRRVWVRARTDSEGRTVVEVAGLVRQENLDLSAEMAAIMDDVTRPGPEASAGSDRAPVKVGSDRGQ